MAKKITLEDGQEIDLDELSPEDQQLALKHKKKQGLLDDFKEFYNKPSFKIPFLPEEKWGDRINGAIAGGATGATAGSVFPGIGTLSGGLTGAAGGALFPPHNVGDLAQMGAAGPLAAASAPIVGAVGNAGKFGGAGKAGMAGLLGFLESKLLEGTGNAANTAAGNPPQNGKLIDFEGLDKLGPNHNNISALLSMLPPALGQALISNMTKGRPISKGLDFAKEQNIPGVSTPSQMPNLESLPVQAQFGQAQQAGSVNPAARQAIEQNIGNLEGRQRQVGNRLGEVEERLKSLDVHQARHDVNKKALEGLKTGQTNAALESAVNPGQPRSAFDLQMEQVQFGKAELEKQKALLREANRAKAPSEVRQKIDDAIAFQTQDNIKREADLLRVKQEQAIAQGGYKQDMGDVNTEIRNTNVKKSLISEKQKKLNLEKTSLKNEDSMLDDSLRAARKQADSWEASNPELAKLALESPNVDILTDNLLKTTPTGLTAYRQHLLSQVNGKDHVKALQDRLVQKFFTLAYDPKTQAPTKANELFKADGPFSPDKIRALFGGVGSKEAEHKVTQFQDFVNDVIKMKESDTGAFSSFNKNVNKASVYALPYTLLFHTSNFPKALGYAAGVKAPLFLAVEYPKLLDAVLKNPKLGDSFHKWATGTDRVTRSLKNWPSLASWIQENGKAVEENEYLSDPASTP